MNIRKMKSVKGEITVPGDKSISHRAVMLGSIAAGTTEISHFLKGADCLATIDCFQKMGIDIDVSENKILVHGKGLYGLSEPKEMLYTANSGTTTRLLCGLLAGQKFNSQITGDASIQKRPMKRVTQPLSLMGANISGDYCPLCITGSALKGIQYDMTVASAQVKTALILAGLYADGEMLINETQQSRNHTELMLSAMGADISANGLRIRVGETKKLIPQKIDVCGDISSAAFFMVLGAIMPNSEIVIRNVGMNETRTGIIDVFQKMGADMKIENRRVVSGEPVADIIVSTSVLKGCEISGALIPRLIDEIPVIAVAAVFADGETVIKNAEELKVKESNRIKAVADEFAKCGIDITETDDGMLIRGGKEIHGADFKSYGDHRMAMSLAILAQLADGNSTIDNAACVDVSFPEFWDLFYGLEK